MDQNMRMMNKKTGSLAVWGQGILLCASFACQSVSAAPLAGQVISNMAIGEYKEEGSTVVQTSRSNLVQTTIIPVHSLTLVANRNVQAVAGQTLYQPHELTNTGNATDSYTLAASNATGDNFDYTGFAVYLDVNHDGVPDGAAMTSYSLAAAESIGLLLVGTLPNSGLSSGNTGNLILTATSSANNQQVANTDMATVSNQSVILVRKSFSVTSANQNDTVMVRLEYQNTSSVASGPVLLTDTFNPAQLSYVAGGEDWNGVPVNPASGNNDPAGIDYQVNSNVLSATLTSVPANTSGYIEFKVQVNQSTAGQIPNTINVAYDDDNNGATPNISTTSNTAILNVKPKYSVEINGIAGSASNAAADNLVVAPAVAQGGVVTFTNYVWNTGNTPDRFNLTFTGSTMPPLSQIEFYRADGVTPLLDSNADGVPDTDELQPNQALQIVVKVRFPTTYADTSSNTYHIYPQAQSLGDSTQTDTVQDQTSLIVTSNAILVDLTNRPETSNNGLGNGSITNGGAAWKTLPVNSGATVVFPLNIKHTGTATSYTFSADADGNFNSIELPAGVTGIHYFLSSNGTDCTALGSEVGQSRLLNDGEQQLYCAVVSVSPTASTVTEPIYFKVVSATYVSSNNVSNPSFDTLENAIAITSLNSTGVVLLSPDLRGQITPGGTVVYSHNLINNTLAALNQSYHFVVSNDQAGFSTTLYYDANDDGVFDSTDPIFADLYVLPSHQLVAGGQVRFFAKVENASYNGVGVVDTTTINLQDGANNPVAAVVDITTVSATQIRLTKLQAKDNNCDGVADGGAGSYSAATLTVGRNADGSGQCVLYRLTVQNLGALGIGAFTFRDNTPAGTVMSRVPSCSNCTSTSAPAVGQAGSVSGALPSIASNTSHDFEFGVRYVGQ